MVEIVWISTNKCFIEFDAASMHQVADNFERRKTKMEIQNIINSIYNAATKGDYMVCVNGPLHQNNVEWLQENNFDVNNGPTAIISW